jgi:hypothetical protein
MCGTPKPLSRRIVTSGRGVMLDAMSPGLTPKVASL